LPDGTGIDCHRRRDGLGGHDCERRADAPDPSLSLLESDLVNDVEAD
jgi:hypothetical protein